MATNSLITDQMIAKRMLMNVRNLAPFAKNVYRQYDKEWEGLKKGDTINLRKPLRFTAQDGPTMVKQALSEESTPLTINFHKHVAWEWSVRQLTTSIEDYDKRYLQPASISLINALEVAIASLYKDVYNYVGTAGTTPSTYETMTLAARKLDEEGCPDDGKRVTILDPAAYWKIGYTLSGLYGGTSTVDKALRKGDTGDMANMGIYKSQNVQTHTIGWAGTTVLVNGASQEGSSLAIDGLTETTTTVKHGDKFTLGSSTTSVYAVNPLTQQSTGSLRCFTATANSTANGSGQATLSIAPKIVSSGAYQSVSAAPGDDCVVNEIATNYTANLAFHPNAFAVAMIPIELPQSCSFKARASFDGFSLAVTKAYDIEGFAEAIRVDIMAAIKCIQPELACIIMG